MKSTDIVDQRKHMRFRVQEGAFAVLMNHVTTVGPIKDISRGGLAFTFISEDKLPQGSFMVDLLFGGDEDFYLKDIPSKIITDFEAIDRPAFSSIPLRRCSVQFEEINPLQISQLESFIRNYTI
jgi:c-di-GMP-binding flagellar brake protein YcgR